MDQPEPRQIKGGRPTIINKQAVGTDQEFEGYKEAPGTFQKKRPSPAPLDGNLNPLWLNQRGGHPINRRSPGL